MGSRRLKKKINNSKMKKIVLGFAGEIAAGKGTAADYVKEKYNGSKFGFSVCLRDVAKRMHLEESRENLQKISTIFRENFHDDILSEVVYEDVKKENNEIIAIDGVRRLADIEYLKKLEGFRLIYIETSMEKRYERIVKRGQNSDDNGKTFEQFQKDHEREAEQQIKNLKNQADFVVDNNGSFEDLYAQIDEIISKKEK
jgi:dephospho-CoA kinase